MLLQAVEVVFSAAIEASAVVDYAFILTLTVQILRVICLNLFIIYASVCYLVIFFIVMYLLHCATVKVQETIDKL